MKRILGQGYIKRVITSVNDGVVEAVGVDTAFARFKVKVPQYLIKSFLDYGQTHLYQDLYNEYYVPIHFKKTDGSTVGAKESLDLNTKFLNYYRFLSNFHEKLVKQGILLEQLAYLLPFGIFVTFEWCPTVAEIIGFLQAYLISEIPERKEIAQALLAYFKEIFPKTAADFLREFDRR